MMLKRNSQKVDAINVARDFVVLRKKYPFPHSPRIRRKSLTWSSCFPSSLTPSLLSWKWVFGLVVFFQFYSKCQWNIKHPLTEGLLIHSFIHSCPYSSNPGCFTSFSLPSFSDNSETLSPYFHLTCMALVLLVLVSISLPPGSLQDSL